MKPYEKLAVDFCTALVEERWQDAHRFLSRSLQDEITPAGLQEQYRGMFRYAEGPATKVHFSSEFSMEDWPAKNDGDVGWAYVGVEGDGFVEAVTVIVSEEESGLSIRSIEWGRP